MCKIDVDQFYGIELGEFPVRIAEVALWMMDHIMNNRLSLEFGQSYVRIPLRNRRTSCMQTHLKLIGLIYLLQVTVHTSWVTRRSEARNIKAMNKERRYAV